MASRSPKPSSVQGFDSNNVTDKMQSSTLKRQPSPDWSKADLLRLLSYFEGELQARDISIATLKAEKAKQLLYQAKYGRFGLGDPFVALQRDAEGRNDTGFDEAAIKSMYDNQLAQLENLIATQRKAQLKMREQLGNSEKRFHKLCTELEDEKQKHAQDTAQGDDVTYMLEKERERLKAEIDFEKSQNKKLEKDLKKTLASLEEERANAARHKQVAIMLIKERKTLIERIIAENQLRDEMELALTDEKNKMQNIAEGLAQESKKSLKMEVAMEKQHNKFDSERESLRARLAEEERQTANLRSEVSRLTQQLEALQQQLRSSGASPSIIQIRSSASPARSLNPSQGPVAGRGGPSSTPISAVSTSLTNTSQSVSPNVNAYSPQGPGSAYGFAGSAARPSVPASSSPGGSSGSKPPFFRAGAPHVVDGGRVGSSSPEREIVFRGEGSASGAAAARRIPGPTGARLGPVGGPGVDRVEVDMGTGSPRVVSVSPGSNTTVTAQGPGRISLHVGSSQGVTGSVQTQLRKVSAGGGVAGPQTSAGRGAPPPIPPNKPNFVSPGGIGKPSPPPKVTGGPYPNVSKPGQPSGRSIPVSVVATPASGQSSQPAVASVRTQVRETSPSAVRKTSQCATDSVMDSARHASPTTTTTSMSSQSPSLEFLGPEMANLHQLLASMTTGETSESDTHVTETRTPNRMERSSNKEQPFTNINTPTATTSSKLTSLDSLIPTVVSSLTFSPNTEVSSPHALSLSDRSTSSSNSKESVPSSNIPFSNIPQSSTSNVGATLSYNSPPAQPTPLHIYTDNAANNSPTTKYTSASVPSSPSVSSAFSTVPTSLSGNNSTAHPPASPVVQLNPPAASPVITAQPQPLSLTSSSPSSRRRSAPTRSRSKSPSKNPHHHHYHNHTRSHSSSQVTPMTFSTPIASPVPTQPSLRLSSPIEVKSSIVHNLAATGSLEALHARLRDFKTDVHLTLRDGSSPLHCATEGNQEACVKLLLERGAKPSCARHDRVTPLHIAALRGYTGCLRCLLSKGAAVNIVTLSTQSPLHMAVQAGHIECCQLLLRHGANSMMTGQDGLTSLHYAVLNNQPEMLKTLLDRLRLTGTTQDSDTAHQLVAMTDKEGWSITHMAAHLNKKDCLVMLAENLPLDFEAKDNMGRPVKAVASPICKALLADIEHPSSPTIKVIVEVRYILENTTVSSVQVGVAEVGPGISWRVMEDQLRAVLQNFLTQLDSGLRTRRITRLDADLERADREFSLGITMSNIKQFEMAFYKWTPGMQTDTSPYLILSNNEQKKVTITVDDSENMCELIAFDVLHPVPSINNYLRLLEQYRSVIFYGPLGSGKSYLAHRLAQSIAAQEKVSGRKPVIYQLTLQPGYTFSSFLAFLKQKNCLVPVNKQVESVAPILLLDNMECVDIAQLFGELLDPIEYRGIGHAFCLRGDEKGENGMHYLVDRFYVLGTMNKSRSLGVDLNILPRFRWVQFRLDTEPLRGLLSRHFLRRIFNLRRGSLPPPDDSILRAVEWVVCVWQRLNDSLNKLGLPEVVMGPCTFFKCPLEKQDQKLILDWLKNLWNQQIAPRVKDAVKRGTGSEAASDGQQKVANTALYVLMQRSVILGCPLTGQEKENYLSTFSGSNELDIPLKPGDVKIRGVSVVSSAPRSAQLPQSRVSGGQLMRPDGTMMAAAASPQGIRVRSRIGTPNQDNSQLPADQHGFGSSNIKRRSLSESSVNKAGQMDQAPQDINGPAANPQAKVAKLEVKSSKVVSLAGAFHSPSQWSQSDTEESASPILGVGIRKTGRVSPLLSLVQGKQAGSNSSFGQKSRSSENIAGSMLMSSSGKAKSPGPFSFSLATPTSTLSSFNFPLMQSGDSKSSITEKMPDFSVFDKVPTPTDELPPSRSFVFVGKPSPKPAPAPGKEEVWSRRTDVFVPIQHQQKEGDRHINSRSDSKS